MHHLSRIRGDPLPVKRWLHKATLAQVKIPLARQQAFAKQHLRALEHVPLHEGALVRHEHIPHVIGMRDEMELEVSHRRARDVALIAVQRQEEPREIFSRS
jgi:hypothetical protein